MLEGVYRNVVKEGDVRAVFMTRIPKTAFDTKDIDSWCCGKLVIQIVWFTSLVMLKGRNFAVACTRTHTRTPHFAGVLWQYMEVLFVFHSVERRAADIYSVTGIPQTSHNAQNTPQQRLTQPPMSMVPRLRKCGYTEATKTFSVTKH